MGNSSVDNIYWIKFALPPPLVSGEESCLAVLVLSKYKYPKGFEKFIPSLETCTKTDPVLGYSGD
jgi:hypothetical protein